MTQFTTPHRIRVVILCFDGCEWIATWMSITNYDYILHTSIINAKITFPRVCIAQAFIIDPHGGEQIYLYRLESPDFEHHDFQIGGPVKLTCVLEDNTPTFLSIAPTTTRRVAVL